MKDIETYNRLRAGLKFDMMRLDDVLIEHPSDIMEAAECCADAMRYRDEMANTLKEVEATASMNLRNEDGKVSEAFVKSAIPLDEDVQKQTRLVEAAKHEAALWQGLVSALQARASSIKRIGELTAAGYMAPDAAYQQRKQELAERRATRKKIA